MLFSELVDAELPKELRGIIDELLDKIMNMPEMGLAPRIKELDAFIEKQFILIKLAADEAEPLEKSWELPDAFFNEQAMKGI